MADKIYWGIGFIICALFVLTNMADGVIDFHGRSSRTVLASEEPESFWVHIVIASILGLYCLRKFVK